MVGGQSSGEIEVKKWRKNRGAPKVTGAAPPNPREGGRDTAAKDRTTQGEASWRGRLKRRGLPVGGGGHGAKVPWAATIKGLKGKVPRWEGAAGF